MQTNSQIFITMTTTIENNNNKPKNCKICGKENSVVFDYDTSESVCCICGAVIPPDDNDDEEAATTLRETLDKQPKKWERKDGYSGYMNNTTLNTEGRHNYVHGLSTMIYSNEIYHENGTNLTSQQKSNAYKLQQT